MNKFILNRSYAAQAQFFGGSNKLENETIFLSSSNHPSPIRGKIHSLAVKIFFEINFEKT
jgi:hypothetical protein